ncbi:hypothetical protein LZ30DRAFT_741367 [Colletotrichum cereale]|nr:hypothetical protein LZ30DRAFT_741367 [Colletotrichum cereale]
MTCNMPIVHLYTSPSGPCCESVCTPTTKPAMGYSPMIEAMYDVYYVVAYCCTGGLSPSLCVRLRMDVEDPGHGRVERRNPLSARFLAADPPGISCILRRVLCIRTCTRTHCERCRPRNARVFVSVIRRRRILHFARCFSRRIYHEAFRFFIVSAIVAPCRGPGTPYYVVCGKGESAFVRVLAQTPVV